MNIVIALLVFSMIVIIHELGHFSLAKANGVFVNEFSLGMGPRIITWVKGDNGVRFFFLAKTDKLESIPEIQNHTWYSVKILPFGGSCMMLGEEEAVESDKAFNKKSVYARMSIIFAGPFFNFILAFVLALIIIGTIGYDPAKITGVDANSPMAEAGFQAGDIITDINGHSIVINREISTYGQFYGFDQNPVTITVERDGKEITKTMTPELVTKDGTSSYRVGFSYSSGRTKVSALSTIKYAAYEVKFWIQTTYQSLWKMIRGKVKADEISGPVGIVKIIGDTVEESKPSGIKYIFLNIFNISILLTANLGVMNLLPIPALDGGRLLMLIIEWIRRKPINPKFEGVVNTVGFMLLMALMVVIMFNDIWNLF